MASIECVDDSAQPQASVRERPRTHDELPAVASVSESRGAATARIKLESLPTLLRAVVSDLSDGGITIEAELPWLSVGTAVHAECPDGLAYDARVHHFDIDVTGSGTARLRIFAARSPEQPPLDAPEAELPWQPTQPRLRPGLAFAAFAAMALLCSSLG
jgi:hypothetical protein